MPTPEPRFEVPPEYAEVYERAYRRAYEHGLGTGLAGAATEGTVVAPEPPRTGRRVATVPATRGRRIAVPRQRGDRDGSLGPPPPRGGTRRAGQPPRPAVAPPTPADDARLVGNAGGARTPVPAPSVPRGHRGVPRTGSTLVPLLGLLALVLMLLAGAFVLGRVTADTGSDAPARPATGIAAPGPSNSASGSTSDPGTAYSGPTAPLHPDAVAAGCTASPGLSPQDVPIGYDATNVLDDDPATAWRCDATAVGQVLDFTMPRNSHVVAVGLVPGYAVTDPATGVDLYAQNNRVTRVLWTFDDGSSVVQDLSPDTQDRSLRLMPVPETVSTHVSMKILSVDPGATGATLISTVGFEMAADGAE